ncbi:hypothetical protein MRX96_046852, partial [Rhipicephalus microplus]
VDHWVRLLKNWSVKLYYT